ncbi:MAG: hypothetical protein LBP53_00775 [Candidatus Peribacteria bacterium]|jgi:hypothetical protein|nr:hypothetical protein [Candidatus Peribacteria bacterium]
MVFLICLLVSLLFACFFYAIDLWYFMLFPLTFFLFMLTHGTRKVFSKIEIDKIRYQHSLLFIWIVIMIGFSGLLFFIGISEISVYLCLLLLNLFLLMGSYVFAYADGKNIFEI